jgi:glucose/arabinose dehydrogenase
MSNFPFKTEIMHPWLTRFFLSIFPIFLGAQPSIELVEIASGFVQPVDIVSDPGGQLYIVEQRGVIKTLSLDGTVAPEPFLDIRDRVNTQGWERGLLGLVFHPNFPETPYCYVNYTDGAGRTRVAQFSVPLESPIAADPASEYLILSVNQPYSNHNAGDLNFGPDGYLYIALGDGGSGGDPQGRSQNRQTLLGKMLRIDVDGGDPYAIPADNPFAQDDFTLDEIWSIGWRNPWRFSFDRATGDMWVADVGQSAWEEIDREPAGAPGGLNYGWRCYEGFAPYNTSGCNEPTAYVPPVHVYANAPAFGCSVTGGYVYRGSQFPNLVGRYIYADYCSDIIWMLSPDPDGGYVNHEALNSSGESFSTFGEGADGELYLAGHSSGKIYWVTDADACTPPAYSSTQVNETCAAAEDGSLAIEGEGLTVSWSTGEEGTGIDNLGAGNYSATVTDAEGCSFEVFFTIANQQPPVPGIYQVSPTELATDDNPAYTYQWYLDSTPVPGAETPSYTATESGDYQVAVTNGLGCTTWSVALTVDISRAPDTVLPLEALISPNPGSDHFLLRGCLPHPRQLQWALLSSSGTLIQEGELEAAPDLTLRLNSSSWPAGSYRLRLTDGQRVATFQLVKL